MASALKAAYRAELNKTRDAVNHQLRGHWRALPAYRDENVPQFLDKALPIIEAGQRRNIALSNAYWSHALGIQPQELDAVGIIANIRGGVPAQTVYERAFTTVWTSIAAIGLAAALDKGLARLTATASMDLQLATRDAAVSFAGRSGQAGWVRVADPTCCDFCQTIDGAVCYGDEPQPLHDRCECDLEPLQASDSRSQGEFTSLAVGSEIGDTLIQEHGEMGPLIVDTNDSFTSLADVKANGYKP